MRYSRRAFLTGKTIRGGFNAVLDSLVKTVLPPVVKTVPSGTGEGDVRPDFSKVARIGDPPASRPAAPEERFTLPGAPSVVADRPAGTAMVVARNCISRGGTACQTCIEHCPEPGALVLSGPTPLVNPRLCTGCGACEPVCPAPQKAIRFLPRPPGLA